MKNVIVCIQLIFVLSDAITQKDSIRANREIASRFNSTGNLSQGARKQEADASLNISAASFDGIVFPDQIIRTTPNFYSQRTLYFTRLGLDEPATSTVFFLRAAFLVVSTFCLIYFYSEAREAIEATTGLKLAHCCCLAYVTLSIGIDLSIKNASLSYGGHFPFHPASGVIVVEFAKCAISLVLLAHSLYHAARIGAEIVLPRKQDVAWLAVPAAIYAVNNLIVFQAIRSCPLSTFAVVRESMLIWNGLIWTATFRQSIPASRWLAICGIFIGCSINQIPKMMNDTWTPGVFWAMLLAFSNAMGAVANEYAMKQRAALDINLQNSILSFQCAIFVVIGTVVCSPERLQNSSSFFEGFVPECWQIIILQVFTGLAASRILKYIEAVTKTVVAAIRGPGVIVLGALLFHTPLGCTEILASLVVCVSCWYYLRQGAMSQAARPATPRILAKEPEKPAAVQK